MTEQKKMLIKNCFTPCPFYLEKDKLPKSCKHPGFFLCKELPASELEEVFYGEKNDISWCPLKKESVIVEIKVDD